MKDAHLMILFCLVIYSTLKISGIIYFFCLIVFSAYFLFAVGRGYFFPERIYSECFQSVYPGQWSLSGLTQNEKSIAFEKVYVHVANGFQADFENVIVSGHELRAEKGVIVLDEKMLLDHKSFLAPLAFKVNHLKVVRYGETYEYQEFESSVIYGGGIEFRTKNLLGEYWNPKCFRMLEK